MPLLSVKAIRYWYINHCLDQQNHAAYHSVAERFECIQFKSVCLCFLLVSVSSRFSSKMTKKAPENELVEFLKITLESLNLLSSHENIVHKVVFSNFFLVLMCISRFLWQCWSHATSCWKRRSETTRRLVWFGYFIKGQWLSFFNSINLQVHHMQDALLCKQCWQHFPWELNPIFPW